MASATDFLFSALDKILDTEQAARQRLADLGYCDRAMERVLQHPSCLSNDELDRRIAEREAALGGEPF